MDLRLAQIDQLCQLPDGRLAASRQLLQRRNHFPYIRTRREAGPTAEWTVAEDDARVLVHPHAFVEVALREADLGLGGPLGLGAETLDDRSPKACGELNGAATGGHC